MMDTLSIEERRGVAHNLAAWIHRDQVDKGGVDYMQHPLRVEARMRPDDWTGRILALLHDTVEDSKDGHSAILSILSFICFPDEIVEALLAITKFPGEPQSTYLDRVKANPIALRVKLADIADNMDESRLALLDMATAKRLREKYAAALRHLRAENPEASKSWVDDVREFHELMEQPSRTVPELPSDEERALRRRLLLEEVKEYIDADIYDDIVEIADGLADMIYIICGTALSYGIPLAEVFAEVHASNMAKRGPDGRIVKREDGKVLKPPGWSPPDIARILREAGWEG